MKCTYNVKLGSVRATVFTVEEQQTLNIPSVFTNHHTTKKCTNCMSFILNHLFKTLFHYNIIVAAYLQICCHNNIITKKFIF